MLNLPIIDSIPGGFYTFCGVSIFLLILLIYLIKRCCCTKSNSNKQKIYTSYYEDDNDNHKLNVKGEEESKDQNYNITYSKLKYKYYLEKDNEFARLENNNNSIDNADNNFIQTYHSTISFNGNGNNNDSIDNDSFLLESGLNQYQSDLHPSLSLLSNSISSYKSTTSNFKDSRKLLAFQTPPYPLPENVRPRLSSSRMRIYNDSNSNSNNSKLMCKIITHKIGVFIRETVKLDSAIVCNSGIANTDGVLEYKTKFFCDNQVTLPVFIKNSNNIINNKNKRTSPGNDKNNPNPTPSLVRSVIRLHVVTEEGISLGWTSATNIKGETLCKDIPDYRNIFNNKNNNHNITTTNRINNKNDLSNLDHMKSSDKLPQHQLPSIGTLPVRYGYSYSKNDNHNSNNNDGYYNTIESYPFSNSITSTNIISSNNNVVGNSIDTVKKHLQLAQKRAVTINNNENPNPNNHNHIDGSDNTTTGNNQNSCLIYDKSYKSVDENHASHASHASLSMINVPMTMLAPIPGTPTANPTVIPTFTSTDITLAHQLEKTNKSRGAFLQMRIGRQILRNKQKAAFIIHASNPLGVNNADLFMPSIYSDEFEGGEDDDDDDDDFYNDCIDASKHHDINPATTPPPTLTRRIRKTLNLNSFPPVSTYNPNPNGPAPNADTAALRVVGMYNEMRYDRLQTLGSIADTASISVLSIDTLNDDDDNDDGMTSQSPSSPLTFKDGMNNLDLNPNPNLNKITHTTSNQNIKYKHHHIHHYKNIDCVGNSNVISELEASTVSGTDKGDDDRMLYTLMYQSQSTISNNSKNNSKNISNNNSNNNSNDNKTANPTIITITNNPKPNPTITTTTNDTNDNNFKNKNKSKFSLGFFGNKTTIRNKSQKQLNSLMQQQFQHDVIKIQHQKTEEITLRLGLGLAPEELGRKKETLIEKPGGVIHNDHDLALLQAQHVIVPPEPELFEEPVSEKKTSRHEGGGGGKNKSKSPDQHYRDGHRHDSHRHGRSDGRGERRIKSRHRTRSPRDTPRTHQHQQRHRQSSDKRRAKGRRKEIDPMLTEKKEEEVVEGGVEVEVENTLIGDVSASPDANDSLSNNKEKQIKNSVIFSHQEREKYDNVTLPTHPLIPYKSKDNSKSKSSNRLMVRKHLQQDPDHDAALIDGNNGHWVYLIDVEEEFQRLEGGEISDDHDNDRASGTEEGLKDENENEDEFVEK